MCFQVPRGEKWSWEKPGQVTFHLENVDLGPNCRICQGIHSSFWVYRPGSLARGLFPGHVLKFRNRARNEGSRDVETKSICKNIRRYKIVHYEFEIGDSLLDQEQLGHNRS